VHIFTDLSRFAMSMLSIVNPLGAVPMFIGLCQRRNRGSSEKISTSAALTTAVTLLVSLFFGQPLLQFFGISIASFTIGGGILLLLTALGMISAGAAAGALTAEPDLRCEREMGMIPLAIPLLAGPGAISISIIAAKKFDTTLHWVGAAVTILLLGVLVKIVLRYSREIGERLGRIGITVMTKVMGLILLATAIEMLASGLKEILPALRGGLS
jgi:multiple antibiotic resistance protein